MDSPSAISRFALAHERLAAEDARRSSWLAEAAKMPEPRPERRIPVVPRNGGAPRGKSNGRARMWTEEQVREIRQRHREGLACYRIAKDLGVNESVVRKVVSRASYAWVED